MVSFFAKVKNMSQKFSVDKEDHAKVTLNLSLEIKEGHEDVSNLAEMLNHSMEFEVKPIQPGLIPPKKS